jgi:hypothetical protein
MSFNLKQIPYSVADTGHRHRVEVENGRVNSAGCPFVFLLWAVDCP